MRKHIFTGTGVAIVTPMFPDGSINYEKFAELIEEQIANSTDAIVVVGTTGEASTLTDEEHVEMIRFCAEKVAKRVPVIAGTGSNDTGYAIELTKEAEKAGADATLQVTPYYNKTSQRGLVAHFNKIADSVNIPTVLYNVPSRTGVSIALDTYIELAKNEKISAVKEASGNLSLAAEIAAHTDFDIYSGNDDQLLPFMAIGAKGVISVSSNVIPKQKHDMVQLFLDGKVKEAWELQKKYLDLENVLFCDVNPIPVKEAMNLLGKDVGECRLPLIRSEEAKIEKIRKELTKAGLLK